jgi:hypothetical protein
MGLHYRSDSEAGERLADGIKDIVNYVAADEKTIVSRTVKEAKEEWARIKR